MEIVEPGDCIYHDAYAKDKKRALIAAADKEKSLRADCERMVN